MDRIGTAFPGHADDLVDRQIGLDRAQPLADPVGLVGLEPVQAQLVLFGIDRDGLLAQFVGGAHHADRDFAPVGHEDLAEIGHLVPCRCLCSCRKLGGFSGGVQRVSRPALVRRHAWWQDRTQARSIAP